ncbi:Werner Syndrome-like exonuclease [Morella rubra]|uniref:Werner Syndrome-like exonuclease n=1 Tax=Morella rubra TaxID=262757 RepID=A0A6A1WBZ8_9ROSI|nr:Werner Syndrome-like exonuclease [Morella rubra]
MSIVFAHELVYPRDQCYNVYLDSDHIRALPTDSPSMVDLWVNYILSIHRRRLDGRGRLIVSLDVEWRPPFLSGARNPIATLQLCVGGDCLIFQIIHAASVPGSLFTFLANSEFTFMGVGIRRDAEMLLEDYGLQVANVVDLAVLAEEKLGIRALRNAGLKRLASEVLGRYIEKPLSITTSRWDNRELTPAQVQYATMDAFLSYEIGRTLNAMG